MIEPKIKVEIRIVLTESEQVLCNSTSKNLMTIFGMLEMAKKAYIEQGLRPKPIIEEARGILPSA